MRFGIADFGLWIWVICLTLPSFVVENPIKYLVIIEKIWYFRGQEVSRPYARAFCVCSRIQCPESSNEPVKKPAALRHPVSSIQALKRVTNTRGGDYMTKKDEKEMKDKAPEIPETSGTAAPTGEQMRIRWDSSSMRSSYANVINAQGTREEIVLFFGMNQTWDAGQRQLTVQLSDRIVLNPFAAKRLSILLNNVIRDYESRYGAMEVETRRPTDSPVQ